VHCKVVAVAGVIRTLVAGHRHEKPKPHNYTELFTNTFTDWYRVLRDISVGIATGYGPDGRVSIPARQYILHHSVEPVWWPCQPPYPVGAAVSLPGGGRG
jgi:hypothetical protein